MIIATLIAFGVIFIATAVVSDRYTPMVGIGGLLIALAVARLMAA